MKVLYFHGRGDTPSSPPGDLVLHHRWSWPLISPVLDDEWHSREFAVQTSLVEDWLAGAPLAIGHSFGAWLLLCAAAHLVSEERPIPPLLLLAPVLGNLRLGRLGFIAPRARSVRASLGLDGHAKELALPPDRLEFLVGASDEQCQSSDIQELEEHYTVTTVAGGHRLDHPAARATLPARLTELEKRVLTDQMRSQGPRQSEP